MRTLSLPPSFPPRDRLSSRAYTASVLQYRLTECGAVPLVLSASSGSAGAPPSTSPGAAIPASPLLGMQRALVLPGSKLAALRRGIQLVVPTDLFNGPHAAEGSDGGGAGEGVG